LAAGFVADLVLPIEVTLLVGVGEIFTEGVRFLLTVVLGAAGLAAALGALALAVVVLGAVALAVGLDALLTLLAGDVRVCLTLLDGALRETERDDEGLEGADLVTLVLGAAGLEGADLATLVLGAAGLAAALGALCLAAAGLDAAALGAAALGEALLAPAACLCLPAAYRGETNMTKAANKIAALLLILYFDANIMNLHSVLPDLPGCKTAVINDRL